MTMSQWFHYQRLIEHYEEEASRSNMIAAFGFAMVGLMVLCSILLAAAGSSGWWIVIFPMFAFVGLGIMGMANAEEARNMIEYIKWRM